MHAVTNRSHAGHELAATGAGHLLRGLYRYRSRPDAVAEVPALKRARVSGSTRTVRGDLQSRNGSRSYQDSAFSDRSSPTQHRVGRGDGQHQEQTDPQEISEAAQVGSGFH